MYCISRFLHRYQLVRPAAITCNHNSKTLKCATLTIADRNKFNEALYTKPNRKYQHDFLLKHMHFSTIQRRRGTGKYSPKTFRTKYTVFNMRMIEVPVCMKAFMAITRYSKNTLLYIANKYHIRDGMIDDERGGFQQEKQFELITDSIETFVSKLSFVETHYCRGRTEKKYLPSELNLTKLYNLYMESIKENPPLPPDSGISIKLSYFRYIVQTKFNISFKMPQQDVCSTCLQFQERSKCEKNEQWI